MAAGNWQLYNSYKLKDGQGTVDWDTDSHYCVLLTATYTPALTHNTLSDLTNEVVDGDYARQNVASEAVTEPVAGTVMHDCGDISFGSSVTITAKYAVLVVGTVAGASGTDQLVGYCDLNSGGGSVSSSSSAFNIVINANGVWRVSQTS